jgi:hypothetical protein
MNASLALVMTLLLSAGDANPIFQQLLDTGVPLSGGPALRMPPPTMPDGLDQAAQTAALDTVANVNQPAEAMLRDSIVSPFVLKIGKEEGPGHGRRIDLWFVVYGDLEKITSKEFADAQMKKRTKEKTDDDAPDKAAELKPEELQARGIVLHNSSNVTESYSHAEFVLFDRVLLGGTSRVMQTKTSESVCIASILDPRFAKDQQYPNFWQHLERDDNRKLIYGEKYPYDSAGSYVKITKMIEPAGALFVEYHTAFEEPEGWFNGANLLRSKLPVLIQDNVRKFRRELK